ncbi:MAG: FeoA family protein [Pseudomonadales bacterium]|jgi:Fe2+ transport system protein FeoA|nr:FeoA family protein [Pseudomonadales bacterium]
MPTTLWDMAEGDSARLAGFSPDLAPSWLLRLEELGFQPGEDVVCVTAPRFGAPRTYRVNNSFFSVDDEIARCMFTGPGSDAA